MVSELRVKQAKFLRLLPRLIDFAHDQGYELGLGEGKRSDEQAVINSMGFTGRTHLAEILESNNLHQLAAAIRNNGKANGIRNSLHGDGLAIDLHLYRDGRYLDKTDDHAPLGAYWESLDPDCRWGGHFDDGNHYSIAFGSRQ